MLHAGSLGQRLADGADQIEALGHRETAPPSLQQVALRARRIAAAEERRVRIVFEIAFRKRTKANELCVVYGKEGEVRRCKLLRHLSNSIPWSSDYPSVQA